MTRAPLGCACVGLGVVGPAGFEVAPPVGDEPVVVGAVARPVEETEGAPPFAAGESSPLVSTARTPTATPATTRIATTTAANGNRGGARWLPLDDMGPTLSRGIAAG